jgi:hypothetical protein
LVQVYHINRGFKELTRKKLPVGIRHEVFKRDNYKCTECGATNETTQLHVDHFIPISKGGTDELANLRTLCKTCNLEKSNLVFSSSSMTLINEKTKQQTIIKFGDKDIDGECPDKNPKTKMVTYDCGEGSEQTLLICDAHFQDECFSRFAKHIVELKH